MEDQKERGEEEPFAIKQRFSTRAYNMQGKMKAASWS